MRFLNFLLFLLIPLMLFGGNKDYPEFVTVNKDSEFVYIEQTKAGVDSAFHITLTDLETLIGGLNVDAFQVGDSTITDTDVATWDLTASRVDQDLKTTASPTFGGLTMNGNLDIDANKLVGNGGSEGISIDAGGNVTTYNSLFFGDGNTGFYEISDNRLAIKIGGADRWEFLTTTFASKTVGGAQINSGASAATVPSFAFGGDSDTGIGRAGANILSLIYGGVEGIRIRSAGIGINKSSPTAALHLVGKGATSSTYTAKFHNSADTPILELRDDGLVLIPDSLHVGDETTYGYYTPGDANWTTTSDSTKKENIKRKKPGTDKRKNRLDKLLQIEEAEYNWSRDKIRKEFDCKYISDWDSLKVTQQDSARIAWCVREESRVDRIASKKRFGPMAQDVASAIGGDGKSINWDKVNSEYRLAVQELIVLVREQQVQIDDLEKRVAKLEKAKTSKW